MKDVSFLVFDADVCTYYKSVLLMILIHTSQFCLFRTATEVEVVSSPLYLLPESSDIYTYAGSTTTPPCSENIRWIIHRQPIVLSEYTVSKRF